MENFVVNMNLVMPVETSNFEMNLDGLLYWGIQKLHGLDEPNEILSILDAILAKENHLYKASQVIWVRSLQKPLSSGVAVHPTCHNWEDYPFDLPKIATKIDKKTGEPSQIVRPMKTIVIKGGQFRARMTKSNTLIAQGAKFYGVGDIHKVRFYLSAIFGLGRNVAQGSGEIDGLNVRPIDDDLSWFGVDEHQQPRLHRALPADMPLPEIFNNLTLEESLRNIAPPYYLSPNNNALCVLPDALIDVLD